MRKYKYIQVKTLLFLYENRLTLFSLFFLKLGGDILKLYENLLLMRKFQECELREQELKKQLKENEDRKRLISMKTLLKEKIELFKIKNQQFKQMKKELALAELKSSGLQNEIKEMEDQIYSGEIQTMKELEKLQQMQRELTGQAEKIETFAITLMEKLEELEKVVSEERQILLKMKDEYGILRLKTIEEIGKIKEELELLYSTKQQIEENISATILEKYKKIKLHKNQPIATVINGKCNGCNMSVSIVVVQEVSRHEKLIYCENCGRILISDK